METATFTISFNQFGTPYTDNFDVIVVDENETLVERNFDIRDVVKQLTSSPAISQGDAKELLKGIGKIDYTGNEPGNHAPTFNLAHPNHPFTNRTIESGSEIEVNSLDGDLSLYFSDEIDAFEDVVYVDVINHSVENPAASFTLESGSWVIAAHHVGTSTFTAIARDGLGGVFEQTFTVTVTPNTAPTLNTSNPVVPFLNHKDAAEKLDHSLIMSGGALLDLNEFFNDTSDDELRYQLELSHGSNTVVESVYVDQLNESSNLVTLFDMYEVYPESVGPYKISKITAYDDEGLHTELNCNIVFDGFNDQQIPENLDLYASNDAGISSLTIEPHTQGWLETSEHIVHISTKSYSDSTVVTPYYYHNNTTGHDYIKFEAGTQSDKSATVKLYTAFTENSEYVWYQNDIHVYLNEPDRDEGGGQSISLYSDFKANFGDYVSMSTVASVTYSYDSGSYVVTVRDIQSPTGTVLTIDPDFGAGTSGSRVYTVPFIKPNETN
ncbi:hypothetical protein [Paenibacillus roseipurpureus]|uniref:Uncharacterized protein n=1 Tax=Paenibacillus roseopurpureus TaxID=2918901 RepID=A0AA96LL83_9BACL|nr:hypothetical protein [Paenibacillus sp. MBLB1832]WNR43156.1 hypothetical protein MJB10_18835 [Paenibacillus sp. MBLB1832]